MGFKREPSASLLDLIEGQPGKDAPGKSQPKLPPPVQPTDPKRKRSAKGKKTANGGRSHSFQEEDEARRASKQLRIMPQTQGQEKEVVAQPEP